MDAEHLVKAITDLVQAQLKLGELITKALGLEERSADPPERPSTTTSPDAEAVERAAYAIQSEMLKHKEVGFASILRTSFPPDEIRRIARAALEGHRREADQAGYRQNQQ